MAEMVWLLLHLSPSLGLAVAELATLWCTKCRQNFLLLLLLLLLQGFSISLLPRQPTCLQCVQGVLAYLGCLQVVMAISLGGGMWPNMKPNKVASCKPQ
jgi:hypothetical protein